MIPRLKPFLNQREIIANQLPANGGVYVPQALRMPLEEKMILFEKVMNTIAEDYSFKTLEEWAKIFKETGHTKIMASK